MKIEFQPHGGSKIDTGSVKVTNLKKPAVDLTPRLKAAISETGISLGDANAPAGAHDIKIDVTDADGRTKSETVSSTVVK
jgi:PIN domain nuclease of toxin-antitoxin system